MAGMKLRGGGMMGGMRVMMGAMGGKSADDNTAWAGGGTHGANKSDDPSQSSKPMGQRPPDQNAQAAPQSADTNQRLDQLERKVDLILEALKAIRPPAGSGPKDASPF